MTDPSLAQRKKRIGGCAMAIAAIVAIPLLLICAYLTWSVHSERQLKAQIEEIRQRGEPVTAEEMEAYYTLEEGKVDTTDLWVRAIQPLESPEFEEDSSNIPIVSFTVDETSIPWAGKDWPELEEAESFLEKYRESIDLMHKAAEQGGAARYPTDFSEGMLMASDHYITRMGGLILHLQARVHAHRGKPAAVARCLTTMIRLGDSTKEEPVYTTQVVRSSIHLTAAKATGDALHETTLTDEQMSELQKAFREIEFDESYRRGLIGERYLGIHTLLTYSDTKIGYEEPLAEYVKQDTATYFALMEKTIDSIELPYSEAMDEAEAMQADVRNMRGLRHAFTRLFFSGNVNSISNRTRHEARMRMADAALAVGRFRLAEGKLPKSLSECVPKYLPEDPVDPFNGGEISYEIGEDGRSYRLICKERSTSKTEGRRQRLEVGDWPEEPETE